MAALHQGYNVFLCHAGENKTFVRQLVAHLETNGLQKGQIFYDEISLQPGDELDSIIKVIESPSLKLFVFVVSKYCFQSNKTWIRAEWEAALENNKPIFPIWLDDNNDGFKAFGNLVREFSYKLRKVIAQRVNPQEISNTLPGLSNNICSLVCGDQPIQQKPSPSTDNDVLAPRQNIMPDVLPAKLKLEFVQKSYNQLLDKAEALYDDDTLKDEERLKEADKIFHRFKARIESIIPKGCFIFNLRFLQPCNVDDFYHDHFRVGPGSLSAALTDILVTDKMRAAAEGEELMVRVEVRYDDYIRVRRQLCMTGVLKSTSVDNLTTLMHPRTERNHIGSNLEGLDLAITCAQDTGFTECVAHPVTRQLANCVKQKLEQVAALTRRLEIQDNIPRGLHREVTHLSKKYEEAQKVLMNKAEEIQQLQESNKTMEATIDELVTAAETKVEAPEELGTPPSGTGAPEELGTLPSGAGGGAPEELGTPGGGAPEELGTPGGGAPEELGTPLFNPVHELDIEVYYKAWKASQHHVTHKSGCRLWFGDRHLRQNVDPNLSPYLYGPADAEQILLPPWQPSGREKDDQVMQDLLNNMEQGLVLAMEGGNVYATRLCKTKVYWKSNDSRNRQAERLERERRVLVFDFHNYLRELSAYGNTGGPKPMSEIIFSFGKRWSHEITLRFAPIYVIVRSRTAHNLMIAVDKGVAGHDAQIMNELPNYSIDDMLSDSDECDKILVELDGLISTLALGLSIES